MFGLHAPASSRMHLILELWVILWRSPPSHWRSKQRQDDTDCKNVERSKHSHINFPRWRFMALARSDVIHYVDQRNSPSSDVVRQYYAQDGSHPAKQKVSMWRKGPQTLLAGISGVRGEGVQTARFWQKIPWFWLVGRVRLLLVALCLTAGIRNFHGGLTKTHM